MNIDPAGLCCYMRGALLIQVLSDPEALNAIMEAVDVPGKPAHLRRMSNAEKLAAIERQAEHLRRSDTSIWYGSSIPEIVAASLYRANLTKSARVELFHGRKTEGELKSPVAAWLKARGMVAFDEVPMGTKRPDVVGHASGGWFSSERVLAIELKNDVEQLKRGLDQMTTFGQYSHAVYLGCTPHMAAEYLNRHGSARNVTRWDARVLESKVKAFGFGLLLVAGDDVHEVVAPRVHEPDGTKVREVVASLRTATKL